MEQYNLLPSPQEPATASYPESLESSVNTQHNFNIVKYYQNKNKPEERSDKQLSNDFNMRDLWSQETNEIFLLLCLWNNDVCSANVNKIARMYHTVHLPIFSTTWNLSYSF